ncbi:unnamed protein product [Bursaphelenchus xylophilus]|uniref:(pine wood nematode) hypothetical protein n=1 Tax=Bursaphelenchus xylophilus TaxID=6326 RepID=A0A811KZR0_BURXY|nr:unnamed protein product [Bursaphelenchus xylophilus]CAG9107156.1 unnamed protein product [Bursaphelenchus xylophilus]
MRFDCVERRFSRLFSRYILVVNRNPLPFLVIPFCLTLFLGVGLNRHTQAFVKDELDLYTPTGAMSRSEFKQLDRLFHINDTDPFYASRRYDIKRTGYIIITGNEEDEDILNPSVLSEAMHLWTIIQSMTVESDKKKFSYSSMCVKFPMPAEFGQTLSLFLSSNQSADQICVSNPMIEIFKFMLKPGQKLLTSALDENLLTQIGETMAMNTAEISQLLGGISLDKQGRISGAKAILLPYALRHATKEEDTIAEKWELKLANYLLTYQSPLIKTSWWTYETLAEESARDREQLIHMLIPCFLVVSLYTVMCCCVKSWIRSRPWLAIGGVLNAAMAIISAVGLLLLLRFKITSIAYSMPFIVFSVGVDNVFIILSSWRATDEKLRFEDRLSEAFGDAAVSITVTSLTDFISFIVGCFTPFPSVQMFCLYAVVAVVFTYFYQLTFFAATMVYTCKRECERRNCLTFQPTVPITTKPLPPNMPPLKYFPSNKEILKKETNTCLAIFFRTKYTDFVMNPYVRTVIVFGFILYLMTATYGCLHLKMGLEPYDLLPDNSYGKKTLKDVEKYFSEYGSYLHVWMYNLSHLNTGHKKLWSMIYDEIQLYEFTEYSGASDCWLRSFLEFMDKNGLDLNSTSFIYNLKNNFLKLPQFYKYKRDVRFTADKGYLEATRIPVQLRFVGSANQSKAMHLFRRLAETSEIPTGVYADFFQFAEQYNAVLPGTLSSIAIAALVVILVSLLLIPEPIAALWVTLSIGSINLGILGFMTYCSVRLDFISMVTIVMSIGFCVDFAAHLTYHYAKSPEEDVKEKVRSAFTLEPCIQAEICWVQSHSALQVLDQLESILFDISCRLNAVKKLNRVPPLRQSEPEPKTANLVAHANRDALSEVSMKHIRANGGVYKSRCVNHFKIPQLQACSALVVRTMGTLQKGRASYDEATKGAVYTLETSQLLCNVLKDVIKQLNECLQSLFAPELRTYQELFHSACVDNFEPAPPSDVLFSFYVSIDRLFLTAYQMTPTPNNSYSIASLHAEARLDSLTQLHQLLNKARLNASLLCSNLEMFHNYLD